MGNELKPGTNVGMDCGWASKVYDSKVTSRSFQGHIKVTSRSNTAESPFPKVFFMITCWNEVLTTLGLVRTWSIRLSEYTQVVSWPWGVHRVNTPLVNNPIRVPRQTAKSGWKSGQRQDWTTQVTTPPALGGHTDGYIWWHGLGLCFMGVWPQGHVKVISRSYQGHIKVKRSRWVYMVAWSSLHHWLHRYRCCHRRHCGLNHFLIWFPSPE